MSLWLLLVSPAAFSQISYDFDSVKADWTRYFDLNPSLKSIEDGDYTKFLRWQMFWKSRVGRDSAHSDYSAVYRKRMQEFYDSIDYYRRSTPVYSDWRLRGPRVMSTQNMGLVSAVYVDTITDPGMRTIYIGTNSSGIWKTTDAGLNWRNVTDGCNFFLNGIRDIIGDPADGNIIYAASGGGFMESHNYSSGIIKTINGGQTWDQFYPLTPETQNSVYRILLDPSNPEHMYAAVDTAILRTLDGGTSWTPILQIPRYGLLANQAWRLCMEMIMKPGNPEVLYVATGYWHGWSGLYNEVWKLSNALAADTGDIVRQRLDTLLPNNGVPVTTERFNIAVTPANPDLLFIACDHEDTLRMWKYSNSSGVFTDEISEFNRSDGIGYFKFEFLASPTDENIVYFGGDGLHRLNKENGQWKWTASVNGGFNSDTYHIDTRDAKIITGSQPGGGGEHDVLFAGNDGGISKTTDGGTTWRSLNGRGLASPSSGGLGATTQSPKFSFAEPRTICGSWILSEDGR